MVKGLFKDSRFYNDPFFTSKEADGVYQKWIENSLHDRTIRTFLVDGSGFIICKKPSKKRGDISLVGVIHKKQGRGIGHNLDYKALDWFKSTGADTVTVRTQVNNIKAMKFYMGLGFRVKYVDVTMGLILD
jgi:dTDP-4-amino-4,6-dideoxy-D-galactose acyltransferase